MTGTAPPEHSFELVAMPLMDQVFSTALHLTRDRSEAEDLVQETYLRAYRFWDRFEPGTNCRAWLMTIAHNQFRNRYREKKKTARDIVLDEGLLDVESQSTASGESDDPERLVLSQVLDEEVEAAMKALPNDYLEAVLLVDVQELTYEEAATAMDCPVGTVRSRLSRGRRLLHKALLDYARERGLVRGE